MKRWPQICISFVALFGLSSLLWPTRQSTEPRAEGLPTQADEPANTTKPPPLPPHVDMPRGEIVLGPGRKLPVHIERIERARLRVVELKPSEYLKASSYTGTFPIEKDPIKEAGFRGRERTHFVASENGGSGEAEIDPFAMGQARLAYVVLDAEGAYPRAAIVQKGGISTLLKIGDQGGLAWVTHTAQGRPEARARVKIFQGKTLRFSGTTNADGILKLPRRDRLELPNAHQDAKHPLHAQTESSSGFSLVKESWSTGIDPWTFDLPQAYYEGRQSIRGLITAERGIYRPGEQVHLLGVMRQRTQKGGLRVPSGKVELRVSDPDGALVHSKSVFLSRYGTFREALKLPKTSRLGRYRVSVSHGGTELSHRFEVGKYRAARFEVQLGKASTKDGEGEDDAIVVPLRAAYLWGSPVKNAKGSYTISTRAGRHVGRKGFWFGGTSGSGLMHAGSGELLLDANGEGKIRIDRSVLERDKSAQRLDLIVEATLEDEAGDSITARKAIPHTRTEALVGVQSKRWVVSPSSGWDLDVVAETPEGKAAPGKLVELELVRRHWVSVAVKERWGTRYSGSYQRTVVTKKHITSEGRPTRVHFDLPGGGDYEVRAKLSGGQYFARESVWAYGAGASGSYDNNPRMSLRADKDGYEPGETATLFVGSPYEKSTALVTVEREGILEARVEQLTSAQTPVQVALRGRHLPNVFASVTVVPRQLGSGGSPAAGVPFRMGYTELKVSPEERRLKVRVEPARKDYRPGEKAQVSVQVHDHRGKPVQAEVTLWAADEGVLMLTGYGTPDPFAPAYKSHPHAVSNATSLTHWMSPDPYDWSGTGGDYDVAEDGQGAFRSRFLGTAFFSKRAVVTNARGEATVEMPLPDNLTRWRVMAAVADSGARFGKAEASFVTNKPLQLVPALPRFLTAGDEVDATFVLHEQSGVGGTAEVDVQVSGGKLQGDAKRTVSLSANSSLPLRFRVKAAKAGEVRFRARAKLAGKRDAVEMTLPVHPPANWQRTQLGEGRIDGTQALAVALPKSAEAGFGELSVTLAPGVLASLEGGVDALLEYPHGCVEQTTSRLIPMVLLEDLLKSSGDERLSGQTHKARMDKSIAHVLDHQNHDGGFGLWPSSDSEGFLTAYALWGLTTAKKHGYRVPSVRLERGFAYLKRHVKDGDDMHGQFSSLETIPFASYVLEYAGRGDTELATKLSKKHTALSRFSVGLLGSALAKHDAGPTLLGSLQGARAIGPKGGAFIREGEGGGTFAHGRDLRATAIAVRAHLDAGRPAEAEALVAGVLNRRQKDGSWGTTYNNLWALYALGGYAKERTGDKPVPVEVKLGGKTLKRLTLTPGSPLKRLSIPARDLPAPGSTTQLELVAPKGSRARFVATLRFVATSQNKKPREHGLKVTRQLLDADTGKAVTQPQRGKVYKVRLTVDSASAREQIALIDRLPAGFEPIDTNLKTSISASDGSSWVWVWRELHDERVTFFADRLPAGARSAEYLVRATRTGSFKRPAARAEAMYDPAVWGEGVAEQLVVR